jgi:hypothetical protein
MGVRGEWGVPEVRDCPRKRQPRAPQGRVADNRPVPPQPRSGTLAANCPMFRRHRHDIG